jgi:predicted GNAT family N-acyltransferase
MTMNLTIRHFGDLDNEMAAIRREVFIVEQGVPEAEEYEAHEDLYTHFCAYDGSVLAGYLRVIREGDCLRVGRVAVRKSCRMQGVGARLMAGAEDYGRMIGCTAAVLNAQLQARGFYLKLGYHEIGGIFLEAGIEHVAMEKPLGLASNHVAEQPIRRTPL